MLDQVKPLSTPAQSSPFFDWKKLVRVTSLLVGLAGGIVVFILVWPDQLKLRSTSLFLACFYILWGTLTHTKAGTFSMKVFWEYAGIAGLGALMLWLIV
jgi:hypothetical protein